jgi:tetratricopeptide (TPR) repeat protein
MVDPISALCLAALTQISVSMTAAGVAGGAIGVAMNVVASRADAMLCVVTNATAGHFIRNIREPVNHDLLKGMIAAHQRAFRHYAETLNRQATAADRPIADKIIALAKKDITFDITPTQALLASVTPLLAGAGDRAMEARHQEFVSAAVTELVAWVETETGETLPPRFVALLTNTAPNGRESWEAKFQLHLAETIKTNARYSNIFIASNIAELVGRTVTIELLAEGLVASVTELHGKVDLVKGDTARILELLEAGALGIQMRASKIDQRAFVSLARRINLEVDEEAQALAELTDAIERLLALEAKAALGTNYETLVDQALKRMADKAIQGDFDGAADEGRKAFAAWEERQLSELQAGIALIFANIEQNHFRRDMPALVNWTMRYISLNHANIPSKFEFLCDVIEIWYDRGCKNGVNFDLGLASALANEAKKLATTADERGKALHWYGNIVYHLGQRAVGEEPLRAAVKAFRGALDEYSRERVPLKWANSQNSLGSALSALGSRERSIALLDESVTAHRASLSECTHERDPFGWALATMSLGSVLGKLGRHDKDNGRLEESLTACRSALTEFTREKDSYHWAATQNNLGVVLNILGERDGGTERLEASIAAFDEVLTEWTKDQLPLDWAATMANKGSAMLKLAERTGDAVALKRAENVISQAGEEASGRHSGIINHCEIQMALARDVRARWKVERA